MSGMAASITNVRGVSTCPTGILIVGGAEALAGLVNAGSLPNRLKPRLHLYGATPGTLRLEAALVSVSHVAYNLRTCNRRKADAWQTSATEQIRIVQQRDHLVIDGERIGYALHCCMTPAPVQNAPPTRPGTHWMVP